MSFIVSTVRVALNSHNSGNFICKPAQLDAFSLADCNLVFSIGETNLDMLLNPTYVTLDVLSWNLLQTMTSV